MYAAVQPPMETPQEKHSRRADGVLLLKPGHSIYLVNPTTLECRRTEPAENPQAELRLDSDKLRNFASLPSTKSMTVPEGWVAVPALNERNAIRKIRKLL
jgi:hypothetical protein